MVKNTKKLKQTFLSIVIVAVVAVGTVFVFRAINQNNNSDPTHSTTTSTTVNSDDSSATSADTEDSLPEREAEKNFYDDHSNSRTGTTVTGIQSYAHLESDGSVLVNFALDQYLSSGTCELDFGGILATSAVEPSAASSFCSVRVVDGSFSSGSTYTYELKVVSGEKSGIISGEVTL